MESVGPEDRSVILISSKTPSAYVTCIAGDLIRVFQPMDFWACNIIFSHVDPDVLLAVSYDQTVRLSVADGSIAEFSGHSREHNCGGDAMVLSHDGTVLYVGYDTAECVVAYDVATLQLVWRADFEDDVCSIAYHDGQVLVGPRAGPLTVLNAEDGSVVRTLVFVHDDVNGISVFTGLFCDFFGESDRTA